MNPDKPAATLSGIIGRQRAKAYRASQQGSDE
jgi:hypothetical protein